MYSTYDCVELTDGLVIKTNDFSKFVNFCEKNDVRLVKFNETSYTYVSNLLQLVEQIVISSSLKMKNYFKQI